MSRAADQRKSALAARRQLTASQRRAAAARACARLARLPAVRRARHIGLYQPLASEIDPRLLIDHLGQRAVFYYPRVTDHTLRFVAARPGARWRRSTLGVHEPRGWGRGIATLDLLILPLAGFDCAAHRIGLGGGFYDRTLALVRHTPYRSPARIGLAFDCQQLPAIEPRPWDVALDAVVTESGVYRRHGAQSG